MIDEVRAVEIIVPGGDRRYSEASVDRGGEIFRALRVGGWLASDSVGRTDDSPSDHSAACQEHRLRGAPMIATRQFVGGGKP